MGALCNRAGAALIITTLWAFQHASVSQRKEQRKGVTLPRHRSPYEGGRQAGFRQISVRKSSRLGGVWIVSLRSRSRPSTEPLDSTGRVNLPAAAVAAAALLTAEVCRPKMRLNHLPEDVYPSPPLGEYWPWMMPLEIDVAQVKNSAESGRIRSRDWAETPQ